MEGSEYYGDFAEFKKVDWDQNSCRREILLSEDHNNKFFKPVNED